MKNTRIAGAVVRRCLQLLVIMLLGFLIVHATPGSPTTGLAVDQAEREHQERVTKSFHLDRPAHEQFLFFCRDLVSGELRSWGLIGQPPVLRSVYNAFIASLPIILMVTLLVWTISFPVGLHSAAHSGSLVDRLMNGAAIVLISVPSFLIAYVLVAVSSGVFDRPFDGQESHWVDIATGEPTTSVADRLWHMCLPSLAIALGAIAFLSRYVRAQAIQVTKEPFVDLTRLRGVPEDVITYRHVLRNALLPVITLFGLYLPWIFSGSVAVELIFGWPGLGSLAFEAFLNRDIPIVLTVNLLVALLVMLGSVAAEVFYRMADPRIRAS